MLVLRQEPLGSWRLSGWPSVHQEGPESPGIWETPAAPWCSPYPCVGPTAHGTWAHPQVKKEHTHEDLAGPLILGKDEQLWSLLVTQKCHPGKHLAQTEPKQRVDRSHLLEHSNSPNSPYPRIFFFNEKKKSSTFYCKLENWKWKSWSVLPKIAHIFAIEKHIP